MTINVTKSVIGLSMAKAPIKVNEHFAVVTDDKGNRTEIIYNPPLLAKVGNLKIELRKELNHNRPHIHLIRKCGKSVYDVSIAINDLVVLAGGHNLKYLDKVEYQKILEFILDNQELLETLYKELRGDL